MANFIFFDSRNSCLLLLKTIANIEWHPRLAERLWRTRASGSGCGGSCFARAATGVRPQAACQTRCSANLTSANPNTSEARAQMLSEDGRPFLSPSPGPIAKRASSRKLEVSSRRANAFCQEHLVNCSWQQAFRVNLFCSRVNPFCSRVNRPPHASIICQRFCTAACTVFEPL